RVDTKVRVWSEPGTLPTPAGVGLAGEAWKDEGTEVVPGHDDLPALVLRGTGQNLPLSLRLHDPAPAAGVAGERPLVQAGGEDGGAEGSRVRFLLAKLTPRHLDVELPVSLSGSRLRVRLDGKEPHQQPLDGSGKVVRLTVEPTLYRKPVILDLAYQ